MCGRHQPNVITLIGKFEIAVIAVPLKLQAFTSTCPSDETRLGYMTIPFWIAAAVLTIGVCPIRASEMLKVTWVQRPSGIPLRLTVPSASAPTTSAVVSELSTTFAPVIAFVGAGAPASPLDP